MRQRLLLLVFLVMCLAAGELRSQNVDHAVAARYAPVFYQALGDKPRSDYITSFDFDGDWRGDNNWANTDNKKYALKAYVYYTVSETETHYLIHYAVFHPRDYKGGEEGGLRLSELLRRGAEAFGANDPTGLLSKATVAHENDMEGCLVAVPKPATKDRIVYLETVAHNLFPKFSTAEARPSGVGRLRMDGDRPRLYIEPRGHGIGAYDGAGELSRSDYIVYRYTGIAEDPEKKSEGPIGYDLLPIRSTLWAKAVLASSKKGPTFGDATDYAAFTITYVSAGKAASRKADPGTIGSAFLGKQGGVNMARPPWGWFDMNRRGDTPGLWFFDPATVIKRDFGLGSEFSTTYTTLPFWAMRSVKKPKG